MDKEQVNKPVISVCIANYNGEPCIIECLNSVFNQSISVPVEVIVHDDASTDKSLELIKSSYPQVQIIESSENVGYCISNNRMAEKARGTYLLLLNNDAQLRPDALNVLYTYALDHATAILSLPQYDKDTGVLLDTGNKVDFFLNPVPQSRLQETQVAMVIGACLWIPGKIWRNIGGFPEWFGSLAEDMYICLAARMMGNPVIVLGSSGYDHYVGKSLGGGKVLRNRLSTTYNRRKLSERNKSYVMVVIYPGILFFSVLPLHILILYLEGILLTIVKRDTKIWKEIYKNILPSLLQRRRELSTLRKIIQESRKATLPHFLSVFVWYPYKIKMLLKHGLPSVK